MKLITYSKNQLIVKNPPEEGIVGYVDTHGIRWTAVVSFLIVLDGNPNDSNELALVSDDPLADSDFLAKELESLYVVENINEITTNGNDVYFL